MALDADDVAAAAAAAVESAELAERAGAPIEAARSRLLYGRALRLAGDAERAVAELGHAHEAASEAGASRVRDECEQELRQAGARPPRRSAPASAPDERKLEALTGRELEIAQLVRDRKMNREIAATLFLSEKTVETHLRNIFGKLGVSSRREVADVIEASARAGGEERR